jgi:mannose-6-phosphate isomerase-like protein (cupin superfamily)
MSHPDVHPGVPGPYPEPVYLGAHGEVSATLRRADASPDVTYPNGVTVHYLANQSSTSGQFGLYRWDFSTAVSGPDPHFHRTISESFFILSGTVRIFDGTAWGDRTAGDFVHVPAGGIHGFRNESGERASMLLLFAPGAPREAYFERLATMATAPMSDEEREAFYLEHDNHWV